MDKVDDRGVSLASPFYPHTVNCFRASMSLTDPQPCRCGGDELMKDIRMPGPFKEET